MPPPILAMQVRKRPRKTVAVNDRMQKGYRYALIARAGRDFDPQFSPDLTPREMLALGAFCASI